MTEDQTTLPGYEPTDIELARPKRRRKSKTIADTVREMAAFQDAKGNTTGRIMVRATRNTLLRDFKPRERGGPLFCDGHQLVHGQQNMVQELEDRLSIERIENRTTFADEHNQKQLTQLNLFQRAFRAVFGGA